MTMIFVELTILVLIPLKGIGFDLPKPLIKVLIFYLHKHLGYRGIER